MEVLNLKNAVLVGFLLVVGDGLIAEARCFSFAVFAMRIPLKTVNDRTGHAQTSTTANIYAHAIRTADEKAAEVISEILFENCMGKR